jgi:hypothetical protein
MPTLYYSLLQKRLIAEIDKASTTYEALPEFRCVLSTNSIVPDIAITGINGITAKIDLSRSPKKR